MSDFIDGLEHDLSIAASVGAPLITAIILVVRKLIRKGVNDANHANRISSLETELQDSKKQLQTQAEEIADLKENQHLLKEEILKELGDVNSKVSNIQGKLSNLKT